MFKIPCMVHGIHVNYREPVSLPAVVRPQCYSLRQWFLSYIYAGNYTTALIGSYVLMGLVCSIQCLELVTLSRVLSVALAVVVNDWHI